MILNTELLENISLRQTDRNNSDSGLKLILHSRSLSQLLTGRSRWSSYSEIKKINKFVASNCRSYLNAFTTH